MQTVECLGINDTAQVQGAIANAGTVLLTGALCKLDATINITQSETSVLLDTKVESSAPIIFNITLEHSTAILPYARRAVLQSTHSFGRGIVIGSQANLASSVDIGRLRIVSADSGLDVVNGSGIFIESLFLNCLPSQWTGVPGVRLRAVDTLSFNYIFTEDFGAGIRMGYDVGRVWQVSGGGLTVERAGATNGVAMHIEPPVNEMVANVQISRIWSRVTKYPMLYNAVAAGSTIKKVQTGMENHLETTATATAKIGNVIDCDYESQYFSVTG